MEIELNERESEILIRVVDGPESGLLAQESEAADACRLYLYGLVTLREGLMRPTSAGVHVVATARVRARVDAAESKLKDAAVRFAHSVRSGPDTDEDRTERFEGLCRAARELVRAEGVALAVAKQQDVARRFHTATDMLSNRRDGQT